MATRSKKTEEDGTSVRTKVVGVRLDPKLRYLAELAARKQRRSISSFIEWAVEQSLSSVLLHDGSGYSGDIDITIADQGGELWDVDDSERFARLAIMHEELLTHEEQVVWKLVKDSGLMWLAGYGRSRNSSPNWDTLNREVFPQLRKHWDTFLKVAKGEIPPDKLPTWKAPDPQKPDVGSDFPF